MSFLTSIRRTSTPRHSSASTPSQRHAGLSPISSSPVFIATPEPSITIPRALHLDQRLDELDVQFDKLDVQLDKHEDEVASQLAAYEDRLDEFGSKIRNLDPKNSAPRLDKHAAQLDIHTAQIDSQLARFAKLEEALDATGRYVRVLESNIRANEEKNAARVLKISHAFSESEERLENGLHTLQTQVTQLSGILEELCKTAKRDEEQRREWEWRRTERSRERERGRERGNASAAVHGSRAIPRARARVTPGVATAIAAGVKRPQPQAFRPPSVIAVHDSTAVDVPINRPTVVRHPRAHPSSIISPSNVRRALANHMSPRERSRTSIVSERRMARTSRLPRASVNGNANQENRAPLSPVN